LAPSAVKTTWSRSAIPRKVPGLGDASRDFAILGTRARIPARMIMRENERRRSREYGRLKDLARMHERLVRCADGHHLVRDQLMPRVEVDREEVLPCMVAYRFANEADHVVGSEQWVRTREAWASVLDADFADEHRAVISIASHVASPVFGATPMAAAFTRTEAADEGVGRRARKCSEGSRQAP
jgi:hypothetical protein